MSRTLGDDGFERDPDTVDEPPMPEPPRRPSVVEFAVAVLGIGGAFGLLQRAFAPILVPEAIGAVGPIYLILVAIDVASIIAAVLLRRGVTWILAANVAAIYAFLQLATQTLTGIVFSAIYLGVVAASYVARDWVEAMRDWRVAVVESRLSR